MKANKILQLIPIQESTIWKVKYPFDPEKAVFDIDTQIDWDGMADEVNMLTGEFDGDIKSGVDLEVPEDLDFLEPGQEDPNDLLIELGELNKKFKDFISNRENFRMSWGESAGSGLPHEAKTPDDAIITSYNFRDAEPEVQIEFDNLMQIAEIKSKYKLMFKIFLKECLHNGNLSFINRHHDTIIEQRIDEEGPLDFYTRIVTLSAVYLKEADFKKAVKGIKGKREKELIEQILSYVGRT